MLDPLRRRWSMSWKSILAVLTIVVLAGLVAIARGRTQAILILEYLGRKPAPEARPPKPPPPPSPPREPWDELITLDRREQDAIGLKTARVEPQAEPIALALLGTTEYDTSSLTRIRPRFDTLVSKAHVNLGEMVRKGDRLVDLYSAELAEAKSNFEEKAAQWEFDRRQLERHQSLFKTNAIAESIYRASVTSETKGKLAYKLARDKLSVYGLTEEEIDRVKDEEGSEKAQMTIRSPTDGIVISWDAVPGNLYDENDILMVVAPLDHLWVWGNVYERDLDKVRLGLPWKVRFPFLDREIRGTVDYIANRIDPVTRTIKVRTTIPNPTGELKSDMLVRGILEIPPVAGRTVVPRIAMVVAEGANYVFVRRPEEPEKFERRAIRVVQERNDRVIVGDGLREGEEVVTNGSVILAQIFENQSMLRETAEVRTGGGRMSLGRRPIPGAGPNDQGEDCWRRHPVGFGHLVNSLPTALCPRR